MRTTNPSQRISDFNTSNYTDNLWLPAIDLTQNTGGQNVKISARNLLNASSSVPQIVSALNTSVDPGTSAKIQLYAPSSTRDIFISSLEIKMGTIAGGNYDYTIYAGDPDNHGAQFFNYNAFAGTSVKDPDFYHPGAQYIPYAFGSTNQIYLVVNNVGGSPLVANVQAMIQEIDGSGAALPGYVYPEPYGGPLFNDVYVSPDAPNMDDHWTEPRYAMMALADGGTMHVAPGRYYLPFGVSNTGDAGLVDYSPSNDDGRTFNPIYNMVMPKNWINFFGWNSTYGQNRFTSINIVGPGNPLNSDPSQRAIFDGRGGYGPGPTHPYRMTRGKAFFYPRVPGTISGIQFWHCGGDDHVGDAEAGIYPESFLAPRGTLTVSNCAFDNCEHGIFAPYPILSYKDPGTWTGENIDLVMEHCDFGYEYSNGGPDGLSHDTYINCYSATLRYCNFYGANGNNIKARTPRLTLDKVFSRGMAGRAIDYPEGGDLTITNCRLGKKVNDGVTTINLLGYANEGGNNVTLGFNNFTATNTIIEIWKWDSIIWIGGGVTAQFDSSSKIDWYALPGQYAPNLVLFTRDNNSSDLSIISGLDLTIPLEAAMATALPPAPPPASSSTDEELDAFVPGT